MKESGKHDGNDWKDRKHNRKNRIIKAAAWMSVFLIAVLLIICDNKTQDVTDDAEVVNMVTEAPGTDIADSENDNNEASHQNEASSHNEKDADSPAGSGGGDVKTEESVNQENGSPEKEMPEDGVYSSKEDVAYYLSLYGHLPSNYITKKEAENLGWQGGSLEPFAPGKCIGGSRFGNYEGLLPAKDGRFYTECDIDTLGADKRGAKRIIFSNDGLIYYTEDHYVTFELLYGEE